MTTTYVYSVVHAEDFHPISDAEPFDDFVTACRVAARLDFPTAILRADDDESNYSHCYEESTGEWIKYC